MKNVLTPLGKSVLTPRGLTAVVSLADADTRKKIYGSVTTASIISNE